jgi:hypothetical protein
MGTNAAGAIWSNTMPSNLEKYLPWLTDAQRAELYGSITLAASYPRGDPVREGVINGTFETPLPRSKLPYHAQVLTDHVQRTTTR